MKKLFFSFLAILLISACGLHEGIVQKAEKSYLKFSGEFVKASVQIDDMQPFALPDSDGNAGAQGSNVPGKILYQVSPGKHSLKVYRNGNLVINRIIILENQATMEIQVP